MSLSSRGEAFHVDISSRRIYRYPLYTGIPAPVAGFDKPESRSQAVGFRSLAPW